MSRTHVRYRAYLIVFTRCDSCGMLADNILQVCDFLLQALYSPDEDNVVDIDKKSVDEGPIGA